MDLSGYLYRTIFTSNSELMDKLTSPEIYHELVTTWAHRLGSLKAKFIAQLQQEKGLIQKTFQQAGKAAGDKQTKTNDLLKTLQQGVKKPPPTNK